MLAERGSGIRHPLNGMSCKHNLKFYILLEELKVLMSDVFKSFLKQFLLTADFVPVFVSCSRVYLEKGDLNLKETA